MLCGVGLCMSEDWMCIHLMVEQLLITMRPVIEENRHQVGDDSNLMFPQEMVSHSD